MDDYIADNLRLWEEWTKIHERSAFYNLDSFKEGKTRDRPFDAAPGVRIRDYEVEELGDVRGMDLLHLQCHFGIDTLSWARLGANVTGIDFSRSAIELARSLAAELGIDARFSVSAINELDGNLDGDFDIVYTSRGALWWLSDMAAWARTAARFVRPGGRLYVAEFHPILQTLDGTPGLQDARIKYPYFPRSAPLSYTVTSSYADRDAEMEGHTEHGWPHSIGEIVTAVAGAGLRIEFLHEFGWVDHQYISLLEQGDDGRWRLPPTVTGELPLMYSLLATTRRRGQR